MVTSIEAREAGFDGSKRERESLVIGKFLLDEPTIAQNRKEVDLIDGIVGFGSKPEVSDGHENVGFRGQSGSRFRGTGCLFIAKTGLTLVR